MIIECGPASDRRIMSIELPDTGPKTLGVFVSGGMDSALLYYMLMKVNNETGNKHTVLPFSVLRKEGSRFFAKPVINYVNSCFGAPRQDLNVVGNNTLNEDEQVASGVIEVLVESRCDVAYVGVIDALPIHTVGWEPFVTTETFNFKTPFKNLTKSHIIDLIFQMKQERLLDLTHSCIMPLERCGNCNGCNERAWGFDQLGRLDPGIF